MRAKLRVSKVAGQIAALDVLSLIGPGQADEVTRAGDGPPLPDRLN